MRVLRDPGRFEVGDVAITGIKGKHADPYGKEFGQINTIWRIEIDGVVIVHLGDNGPLTKKNIAELGRVDILMTPLDATDHILKRSEVQAIRDALKPSVVIPMHYRHPELEKSGQPKSLGDLEPCLKDEENVRRIEGNRVRFSRESLPKGQQVVVLRVSPLLLPEDR